MGCWKENKYWAKLIHRGPLVLLLTDHLHQSSNGGRGKKRGEVMSLSLEEWGKTALPPGSDAV